jgi:beta-lactamase regulating signal transducer with metallopeptidase domain
MMPDSLTSGLARIAMMNAGTVLLGKATLLLAVGWLLHAALARANPRWRVLLWRGVAVGLVLLPLGALGWPALEIRVATPEPAAAESAPAIVAPSFAPVAARRDARAFTPAAGPLLDKPAVPPPPPAARHAQPAEIVPEATSAAEPGNPSIPWHAVLVSTWGLGVVLLAVRLATGYLRLARLLRALQDPPEAVVAEARRIAAVLGCRRDAKVRSSRQCAVPFVCGLRSVVVLPERMCGPAYRRQLPAVLAHELAHVRSRDWGWSAGLQVMSILLWFHPLVWRIGQAHRAACDAVCDAMSASYLGDVQAYCRTLAGIALEAAASGATGALAMARVCDVRRRIAVLGRRVFAKRLKPRAVAGVTLVGLTALALFAGVRLALAEPSPPANPEPTAAVAPQEAAQANAPKGQESSKSGPEAAAKPAMRPMRIRVADRSGKPIAGAEVRTSAVVRRKLTHTGPFTYRTNPEGVAVIDVPQEEVTYLVIFARAEGYVTAGAHWESEDGSDRVPSEFDFTLEPGTVMGGIVRDEHGRPVAGVEVSFLGQENAPGGRRFTQTDDKVKTDAEGKWISRRVPKVLSGLGTSIHLKHPDYASPPAFDLSMLPIERLRAPTAVMVLRKGVAVEGTVTDPKGRPMADIKVGLFRELVGSDFPRAATDSKGHYQLPRCEPGEYLIAAAAPSYAPAFRRLTVGPDQRTVDLQFTEGEPIRLRIVDQEGKPVPGVQVIRVSSGRFPSLVAMADWPYTADAEGRWSCAWIPGDGIDLILRKRGYAEVRKTFTPKDGEQVVTLEKGSAWIVSGRVTDKQTKAPVLKFQVVEGYAYGSGDYDLNWRKGRPTEHRNGEYTVQWDTSGDSHRVIRVEADGYLPSQTRWLMMNERRVTLDVELEKGQAVSGTVRAPDGKPLADADVVLCTPMRGLYLTNGREFRRDESLAVRTGDDGRFSFPPQRDPYVLVVLHDRGYAEVEGETGPRDIAVQPWARVEGTLRTGSRPGANEEIRLDAHAIRGGRGVTPLQRASERVFLHYGVKSDREGRFVFDRVWPGKVYIQQVVMLWQEGQATYWGVTRLVPVELLPGQTVHKDLGGTGRPVIGRVVPPGGSYAGLDLSGNGIQAKRLLPDIPWPAEAKQMPEFDPRLSEADRRSNWWHQRETWQDQWLASEAGRAYRGDRTLLVGTGLKSDGSFRVEDVPPGEYRFFGPIFPRGKIVRHEERDQVGRLDFEFTVPAMPGGRSDQPLDLGRLPLDDPFAR